MNDATQIPPQAALPLVAALSGESLHHWVAIALGWKQRLWGAIPIWFDPAQGNRFRCNARDWKPSENWSQLGPLVESMGISLTNRKDHWFADCPGGSAQGETAAVAICRCIVEAAFGPRVPHERR